MTVFDVLDTVGVALVIAGMVLFVCFAVHEAFRAPRRLEDDDDHGELDEREQRRRRAQERQARAMLRPPRDIVVAAGGREPTHADFVRALRSGADL